MDVILSETHQFYVRLSPSIEKNILIVTVVLHNNLGINSLLFIDHILSSPKLNFVVRLAHRALRSPQCGHRLKNFGDPCNRRLVISDRN